MRTYSFNGKDMPKVGDRVMTLTFDSNLRKTVVNGEGTVESVGTMWGGLREYWRGDLVVVRRDGAASAALFEAQELAHLD